MENRIIFSDSIYIFKLTPLATPKLIRNYQKYTFTEKFRVNSNQNLSDVWLLYKNDTDNSTWKYTILTRVNLAKKIDPKLYNNFLENDVKTAWYYAFDPIIAKKNGAIIDTNLEYEIEGPTLEEIITSPLEEVSAKICSEFYINMNIKKILKSALNINGRTLEKLIDYNGIILKEKLSKKFGYELEFKLNLPHVKNIVEQPFSQSKKPDR